jgi:predicted O-methyltransferase YrrM
MLSRIRGASVREAFRHRMSAVRDRVTHGHPTPPAADPLPSLGEQARDYPEFVPPGHFYSAIPDPSDIESLALRMSEVRPLDALGIDFNVDGQLSILESMAPLAGDIAFQDEPSRTSRYHFVNGWYERSDGVFLHLVTRYLRPSRIVEVGSGYSSACVLDTLAQAKIDSTCVFIDPDLTRIDRLFTPEDRAAHTVVQSRVQDVPISLFTELGPGDLLVVDSSHVVKAGSDVNFLFFHVLPRLASGVIVHLHDVLPTFEYPLAWLREPRAWSEAYLLRAFLQYNSAFEIFLWPSLIADADPAALDRFPFDRSNPGSSIYLRRL